MKPPPVPKVVGPARVLPSGFRIENCARQQFDPTCRLTRWPTEPENEILASWPEVEVVTTSGAPPGAIVPVTSTGTSASERVMLPVLAPWGSTRIVYVPVTGSVLESMKPPFVQTVVEASTSES